MSHLLTGECQSVLIMYPLGVEKSRMLYRNFKRAESTSEPLSLTRRGSSGDNDSAQKSLLIFIIHNTGKSQLLKEINHSHLVFTKLVELTGDNPSIAF